jgi:membrane-associated phospholipid phosphatase
MRKLATEGWRSKVGLVLQVLLLLCLCTRGIYGQTAGDTSQPSGPPSTVPQAQAPGQKTSTLKLFRQTIWSDQKAIWTSPFHMNDGKAATIAAIPLIVGTGALIAVDKDAAKWLPNTPDQVKWSKRVSQLGAAYTLGGVVSGMMLIGKKKDEPEIFKTGRTSARALVDALIVGYTLKFTTARERPVDNEGQGRFWKGSDSFPSGHVIDSWAVTTVILKSRSPKWLKITSLTIASAVSLSRWGAQRHFPSDILAGGVMGGLIGNFVANHQDSSRMFGP